MFLTNWNISASNIDEAYLVPTSPRVYNDTDGPCSSATSSACSRQLIFFLCLGLIGGCLPINGLRLSTLKCFYNLSCVAKLFRLANISSILFSISLHQLVLIPYH